jgi:hypothetical protein
MSHRGGDAPPPVRQTEGNAIIVTARLASDAEVTRWRDDGWILVEGLVGTEEIDEVADDLRKVFRVPKSSTLTQME